MPANPVAENVLGTMGKLAFVSNLDIRELEAGTDIDSRLLVAGTICWTIQLVPQVWKSWRTKSTEGLSEYLG